MTMTAYALEGTETSDQKPTAGSVVLSYLQALVAARDCAAAALMVSSELPEGRPEETRAAAGKARPWQQQ